MPDTPPWLEYQQPQGITVPLGPRDPYKSAAEARAERADARAAAADRRAQADFDSKNTMVPPPGDTTKTGEEYLATIPPSLAGQVKALSEGRRAFPTGAALRSPSVQELIAAATQYDPTLDAANAATRVATRKKFTSGTTRDNITAINTALGHLGSLSRDAAALDNSHFPLWNTLANATVSAVGDPRVSKFNMTKHAVVDELEKAFRGSGGTQAGIDEWTKAINSSQSPDQLRGAISKGVELLSSRLDALNDAYTQGMGHSADPMTFLNPHAQQVFQALGPGGTGKLPPDDPKGGGGAPPILGGDPMTPATGGSRTEVTRGPVEQKLSAMLASGTPSANIRAYAKQNDFPSGKVESVLAWRAMHPEYRGGYDVSTEKIIPTTAYQRAAASPVAAGLLAAADAGTGGTIDEAAGAVNALRTGQPLGQSIASADLGKQMLLNANPNAALAGNVVGGVGAMMGGGAALKGLGLARSGMLPAALGDAAYGGIYGAGENNDNRLLGAAVGAPAGLVGSLAGQGATKAIGAGLRGVANPAVDRLRAAGIPLTTGEVLGGGWKKAQDAMTSVFGPGNMVARRYNEGRQALNQAAFNEAGNTIGVPINQVGQEGIDALNAAKSQAYSAALDPVTVNLNNPSFINDMQAIRSKAIGIPNDEGASEAAQNALTYRIGNAVDPATGDLSGRNFQEAYRGLARTARERAPKAYGHEVGQTMREAQDALANTLKAQAPGAFEGFQKANTANRYLNVLSDALNQAKSQVSDEGQQLFTPAQLGSAATSSAKKFGSNIAAASGDRPFNQLALDAQQVMSSKLPESGTAPRWLMTSLATGGLGGAGGALGYGAGGGEGAVEGAAVPLGALTLLGTRRGQQLLTAALLKRIAPFRIAGDTLSNNPQIGGDILAAAGVPLLTSR